MFSLSCFACHTCSRQSRGHPEQVNGDTLRVPLVAHFDAYKTLGSDLRVADFRRWEIPILCPNEVAKVVGT